MAMRIFVGSLSHSVNDEELERTFSQFGTVRSAQVIMDRETRTSKGFGFVEMSSDSEAQNAIRGLNGKEIAGRTVAVNEARAQENRPRRPSGGGGRY